MSTPSAIVIDLEQVTIVDPSQQNVLAVDVSSGSCDEYPIIFKPKPTSTEGAQEYKYIKNYEKGSYAHIQFFNFKAV